MFHPNNPVDNEEYYNTLDIKKTATKDEIKKAYHKMAKKYHPDRVTDPSLLTEYNEKFQKIGEAYETLSDDEKRQTYDQFGKNPQMNQMNNMDPGFNNLFNNIFRHGGFDFGPHTNMHRNNSTNDAFMKKRFKKSAPVVHQVNLSLEDLFNGRTIKLKITKQTIFSHVMDEPVPIDELENTWTTCDNCDGNGIRMIQQQIAPGFIAQQQVPCQPCLGTGNKLKGEYYLGDHPQIVEIDIKRGTDIRYEHIIENGGNCFPGALPGDILIGFQLEPHTIFTVKGNNLIMTKKILLSEALCGSDFIIKHLDNSSVRIRCKDIITPGTTKTIKNLGMFDKFGIRGNLLIQFDVVFPDNLLIHNKKKLSKCLPKADPIVSDIEPINI